jgi:hypothetical protein
MGLEVGGCEDRTSWPKLGPSLLIATCLIVAIRTSKWPPRLDTSTSGSDFNDEIGFAINLASRVMGTLVQRYESSFPRRKEPWYRAIEDEDVRK